MQQAWCEAGRRTGEEQATEEGLLLHAGRAGDRDALDRLLAMHERALVQYLVATRLIVVRHACLPEGEDGLRIRHGGRAMQRRALVPMKARDVQIARKSPQNQGSRREREIGHGHAAYKVRAKRSTRVI